MCSASKTPPPPIVAAILIRERPAIFDESAMIDTTWTRKTTGLIGDHRVFCHEVLKLVSKVVRAAEPSAIWLMSTGKDARDCRARHVGGSVPCACGHRSAPEM